MYRLCIGYVSEQTRGKKVKGENGKVKGENGKRKTENGKVKGEENEG